MNKNFYQKGFLEKRWFSLNSNGLSVRTKKIGKVSDYEINYEDIGTRLRVSTKDIAVLRLISIVSGVIGIIVFIARLSGQDVERWAELIYLSITVGSGASYYFTSKKLLYLLKSNNTNAIEFLYNKPTETELETFINLIRLSRREHLLKLYGQLNPKLSYEQQHNNMLWLLNAEVITEAEFQDKINHLEKMFPLTTTVKGFAFGQN